MNFSSYWILFISVFFSMNTYALTEIKHYGTQLDTDSWYTEPYQAGFSTLEMPAHITYGLSGVGVNENLAVFPKTPVVGEVKIPVLLVDWDDYDPKVDLSNPTNPSSTLPDYQKFTPEEIAGHLNGTLGVSDYFMSVSGQNLKITFDVIGWIKSGESAYLKNRSEYISETSPGTFNGDRTRLVKDALKAAIAEKNVDFRNYDADQNQILDGLVLLYEGHAGLLSGTNMSWTHNTYDIEKGPIFNNLKRLVDANDQNFNRFQSQNILYKRYLNIPEVEKTRKLKSQITWAHELGHLLLGFRDYYTNQGTRSLNGYYLLSSNSGYGDTPLHPSALEKWLFGGWIKPQVISDKNSSTHQKLILNHHIKEGDTYIHFKKRCQSRYVYSKSMCEQDSYLYTIPINGDPEHFLAIENRDFEGSSIYNTFDRTPGMESGLVIFEVNKRESNSALQINRHIPFGWESESLYRQKGAYMPGMSFTYKKGDFEVIIDRIDYSRSPKRSYLHGFFGSLSSNSYIYGDPNSNPMSFRVRFPHKGNETSKLTAIEATGSTPANIILKNPVVKRPITLKPILRTPSNKPTLFPSKQQR